MNYDNEYGWKLSTDAVEKLILKNRIHFVPKSKNMYIKVYKHEHKGKPLSNLWDDIHSITRTSRYPRLNQTQKPQKKKRRIKIFTNSYRTIIHVHSLSNLFFYPLNKLLHELFQY